MKKTKNILIFLLIPLFGIVLWPFKAEAVLTLSINPVEGGNSLRFGRVNPSLEINKEVKIRMTSSDGKQYQVFQRLVEPLVNESNVTLNLDAIKTYALTGSNSSGTLYLQNIENLSFADQLLYTSSSNGESDSFTVVYSTKGDRVNAQGNFTGKIIYTVRSIGNNTQDTAFLTTTLESSGQLKIDVEGSTSKDTVRLRYKDRPDQEGYVKISFSENAGQKIKVYQEVESFPQDELLEEISANTLQWTASGGTQGELYYQSPSHLERKKIFLYSSTQPEDSFVINFFVNPNGIENQKAGIYKGKLHYIVETDNHSSKEFLVNLELAVDPIFKLDVTLPPEGMRFNNLLPDSPPQIKEVGVTVKSNLGKPYMVIQSVASPLINGKGHEIKKEYFSMNTELTAAGGGRAALSEFNPVSLKETPIFFSDSRGSSSSFKVIYRLRSYPDIAAGDYSTSIVYSLSEM